MWGFGFFVVFFEIFFFLLFGLVIVFVELVVWLVFNGGNRSGIVFVFVMCRGSIIVFGCSVLGSVVVV